VAYFTAAIQRELFFLFLLDKNDILTFVITHKIETAKENGIMYYQMVRWQKIASLMDIS
jgi:hypothetical protein